MEPEVESDLATMPSFAVNTNRGSAPTSAVPAPTSSSRNRPWQPARLLKIAVIVLLVYAGIRRRGSMEVFLEDDTFALFDKAAKPRATLRLWPDGVPRLALNDKDGGVIWSAP